MADGSKTEKATPKKRRDERKKGNVFLSQDAVSVATLLTSACLLIAMADGIAARLGEFIVFCVRSCARPVGTAADAWMEIGRQAGVVLVKTALPLLAVTALCAIAVTFAQTRLLVSGELLKPKFNRINPLQGIKRLFSLKSVVDAFKGVLKITLLMIIIFSCLRDRFLESSKYLYTDLDMASRHIFESGKSMVLRIVLAFAVVAALDYFYQWWDYERQLRMSKQEIKEEYKQTEGDPQIKGKIKENQRRMAQRRMMQQVPKAVKEERAHRAAVAAEEMHRAYLAGCVGKTYPVLFEQPKNGKFFGHAPNYMEVLVDGTELHNVLKNVRIIGVDGEALLGEIVEQEAEA